MFIKGKITNVDHFQIYFINMDQMTKILHGSDEIVTIDMKSLRIVVFSFKI